MPSRKRKQQQKKSTDLSEGEYFEKQEKEVNSFPGMIISMLSADSDSFQKIVNQEKNFPKKDMERIGRTVNDLGYCYAESYGVERDLCKAIRCFALAASFGYEMAAENLEKFTAATSEDETQEDKETMESLPNVAVQNTRGTSLVDSKGSKRHKS